MEIISTMKMSFLFLFLFLIGNSGICEEHKTSNSWLADLTHSTKRDVRRDFAVSTAKARQFLPTSAAHMCVPAFYHVCP
jgi:hypothetical protein